MCCQYRMLTVLALSYLYGGASASPGRKSTRKSRPDSAQEHIHATETRRDTSTVQRVGRRNVSPSGSLSSPRSNPTPPKLSPTFAQLKIAHEPTADKHAVKMLLDEEAVADFEEDHDAIVKLISEMARIDYAALFYHVQQIARTLRLRNLDVNKAHPTEISRVRKSNAAVFDRLRRLVDLSLEIKHNVDALMQDPALTWPSEDEERDERRQRQRSRRGPKGRE